MTSTDRRRMTPAIVAIIASVFVVAFGAQAWLAQQDNADRDAAAAAQDRRDRAYADCLTEFAADLVATIDTRTQASAALERAEARLARANEAKSRALDEVIVTVLLARRIPPEASEAEFDAALEARVAAQTRYDAVRDDVDRIRARVDEVRADNQYVSPEVVCTR